MTNYNNITTVNNMTTRGGNDAPNQFNLEGGGLRYFQSYNSIIVIMDYNKDIITFGRDWDYSNTTRNYMYQFLRYNGLELQGINDIREWIDEGVLITNHTKWLVKYDEELK